ncbi:MAG: AraC family transcriptional regulator [Treponema sp.]|jgi:AraC-like DNA-binding protein|nr:AraC family transcriptional regulator [Treponema sp.]
MRVHEKGVLPESNLYFHTPSETDRKLLLIPSSCGHYFCNDTYHVARVDYGNFLLLFVKTGNGYVYVDGRKTILSENDAFLLDCYHQHSYGSLSSLMEILWIHFGGAMARSYFDVIARGANCAVLSPRDPQNVYNNIYNIYEQFHEKKFANDVLNNKYIVNLLTEFLLGNSLVPDRKNAIREDLLAYITENIQLPLRLEDLAARVALSPYYFTRQFKKETGYTPHQYLLVARINAAKHFLKNTTLSNKEIAFACGFSSESGFCIAFKRMVKTSPMTYRGSLS